MKKLLLFLVGLFIVILSTSCHIQRDLTDVQPRVNIDYNLYSNVDLIDPYYISYESRLRHFHSSYYFGLYYGYWYNPYLDYTYYYYTPYNWYYYNYPYYWQYQQHYYHNWQHNWNNNTNIYYGPRKPRTNNNGTPNSQPRKPRVVQKEDNRAYWQKKQPTVTIHMKQDVRQTPKQNIRQQEPRKRVQQPKPNIIPNKSQSKPIYNKTPRRR